MDSYEEHVIEILTDTTNRAVLTALNDAARALPVTEIAEELVSKDVAVVRSADYEDELERALISLHHTHLPRLDEAGLIDYDRDGNVVRYGDYTAVDAEWRELDVIDELLSRFRTGGEFDESAIGVIDGQGDVCEYSRELADRAERELFLIYTSDTLLEDECRPHAENAIDRGVDIYAGTKCRAVRTFFRKHLPEATVWEPQLDWMNEESSYPKISRLIFADRTKVIVGLWTESAADGTKTEIAMIGEGATNPLVVLVRELLGPRLDHLDYQSEDFLQNLPFEP